MRRHATAPTAGTRDLTTSTFGRSAFAFALASVAACLLIWVSAVPAQAATNYAYQGESGNGTLGEAPTDAAIDDMTGYLLVADSSNDRVVVFESTQPGASVLTTFGAGELSDPYGIAVDPSGDVYVADAGNDRIVRYTSDGATPPTYTLDGTYTSPAKGTGAEEVGDFASTLAIDPANGDLLVADKGNLRVERFDSSGAYVDSFNGADSDAGAFTSLLDISTGPDSAIYLIANGTLDPDWGSVSGSVVDKFAADGTFVEALAPGQLENARALGYEAHLDNVLVTSGGSYLEGNPDTVGNDMFLRALHDGNLIGSYEIPTPQEASLVMAVAVPASPSAPLSILTGRTVPVAYGMSSVLSVKGFQVDVDLSAPTAITGSGAHLSGTVDPHGGSGEAHFEYRLVGAGDWISQPSQNVSGEGPQPVEEDLTGLLANGSYEVRLSANAGGASDTTPAQQFKTSSVVPTAVTENATEIGATTATLTGSVNPNGTVTTWYFEYGPTESYGTRIPLISAPAGNGHKALRFSREISGLVAGSTYHFRIVAENSAGTAQGVDESFVAGGVAPEGRVFELVTTGDLHGAAIDPQFGTAVIPGGFSFVAKPLGGEASSAPYYPRLLSKRGSSNWEAPIATDPPVNENGLLLYKTTLAISRDGNWAFVVSNKKLTPDAGEGRTTANLYTENLRTGAYELIGTGPSSSLEEFISTVGSEAFLGAAPDFSWVVFQAVHPLLDGVSQRAIYRWSRSQGLEVISRLPSGEIANAPTAYLAYRLNHGRRYVSTDGNAVEFGVTSEFPLGPVYVRSGGDTIPLSVSELDGELKPGFPWGISADGRYAYFTAEGKLTPDATDSQRSMYRYDLATDTLEYVDEVLSAGSFSYAATIFDISADGSSIAYRENNLDDVLATRFNIWHNGVIDTLSEGRPDEQFQSVQFSPNGRYLVYSDAVSPYSGPDPPNVYGDIYIYDLQTHTRECASCVGGEPTRLSYLPLGEKIFNNRLPQAVDDSGRVFFGSAAQLSPRDSNSEPDVYVYQGGRRALISPGSEGLSSLLMDISEDGRDVYFATSQSIVPVDVDGEVDIYDARIGGGLPIQSVLPSPSCSGEACQGAAPGTPGTPSAGSEEATGETAKAKPEKHRCRKGKVKRRGRCVKPKGKHRKRPTAHAHRTAGGPR